MRIRLVNPPELPLLQAIEIAAGEPFREFGMQEIADDDPPAFDMLKTYASEGQCWVAVEESDDQPTAYLLAARVDGTAYIEQVTVAPAAARRGLGRALIDHLDHWAITQGLTALTLTTFSEIPWNAPYYARLGFRTLEADEVGEELRAIRAQEAERGLDRWPRVCMRRELRSE
ncbi:hypothetical protein FQN52_006149 [Onygenales sp. PD_12]|nr:hypothetical protein FQN52_006149 [Onygenales sp. PD_12]